MNSIVNLYRKHMPIVLRNYLGELRTYRMKHACFEQVKSGKWMLEYEAESKYMIEQGELMTFPYEWVRQYQAKGIKVFHDTKKSMPYVKVKNGNLYFPAKYPDKYIQKYFNTILIEQDFRSPHFYFEPNNMRLENSVFFDIGGAEGYISLEVIPYVNELVIFECDESWIKALNATFEPWKEKVQIINKLASSRFNQNEMRIDAVKTEWQKVIIKVDVEGMEKEVLTGAENLLKLRDTEVYVCTYHKKDDETELSDLLIKCDFILEKSDGVMFYGLGEDAGFRKGLIRAKKC